MQPRIQIQLEEILRYEDGSRLKMTVSKGDESETLSLPVAEEAALSFEAILKEEPFRQTKAGSYRREVHETIEGSGLPKTLVIEISKGRSRTKRSLAVGQELFLLAWNIFHYREIPSRLPPQRRQT